MDLDLICALIIGTLVVAVTSLIISVKTMTLLVHIIRKKDAFICPGHSARWQNNSKRCPIGPTETIYDSPSEYNEGSRYDVLGVSNDFQRGASRTDVKRIHERADTTMMNDAVYHEASAIGLAHHALMQNVVGQTGGQGPPVTQRNATRRSPPTAHVV